MTSFPIKTTKARILVVVTALIVIWIAMAVFYVPSRDLSESDITSERVIKVMRVCKEIPTPPEFILVNRSWGQRINGAAHYSFSYRGEMQFDDMLSYYNKELSERGFTGGAWSDSTSERSIAYEKQGVRVNVAYRLRWSTWSEIAFNKTWTAYVWCDDRPLNAG